MTKRIKKKKTAHEKAIDSFEKKVGLLMRKAFGARAAWIFEGTPGVNTMRFIERAFKSEHTIKDAWEIGFQMGDWGRDAAYMLALHLFPEKFTAAEIRALVMAVIIHVPNHIAAAAALLDCPISDTWGTLKRKRKEKLLSRRSKPIRNASRKRQRKRPRND